METGSKYDLEDDRLVWLTEGHPTTKGQGDVFEEFLCWWLMADPEMQVSYAFSEVKVASESTHNPHSQDLGIDLIGVTVDGDLWAIQAKAYQEDASIEKDVVSNLVGVTPSHFKGRMVATTAARFTANAVAVAEQEDVTLISRFKLEESEAPNFPTSLVEFRNLTTNPPAPQVLKTPNPLHQAPAIAAAIAGFETDWRGQLIMACGTGKTLTALWFKEQLFASGKKDGDGTAVVLLPSISLLEQTLREWSANRATDWRALAVCSDASIKASAPKDGEADMRVLDTGLPATTSETDIAEFLGKAGEKIIFSTYQSSDKLAAAAKLMGTTFDLVICDEAHRLAGAKGKAYSSILDDNAFSVSRRLFMTATPRTVRKGKHDAEVLSMDDSSLFGKEFFRYDFSQAIADDVLTDYEVIVSVITEEEARTMAAEGKFVEVEGVKTDFRDLAAAIAVLKAAKKHGVSRAISFHSRVKRAQDFSALIEKVAPLIEGGVSNVHASSVNGAMLAVDRKKALDVLKVGPAELTLVSNAQCLTEGVDVPALDGVIFVDPRRSEVDIVQAVGRAIRKSDTKGKGKIIVPLVTSKENLIDGSLDAEGHDKLRQVLWALRDHDKQLAIEIDNIITGKARSRGSRNSKSLPEKIVVELCSEELSGFATHIETQVVRIGSPDSNWLDRYNAAVAHYVTNGEWPSREAKDPEVKKLGTWVRTQRTHGKKLAADGKSPLSRERYDRLDGTDGWQWDLHVATWENAYSAAVAYYVTNGEWPSACDGDPKIKKLGTWVNTQRIQGKKPTASGKSRLSRERYDRLDKTDGWVWVVLVATWEDSYNAAVAYYTAHGKWPSGEDKDPEVKKLGNWVVNQRQQGKKLTAGGESDMTRERYDRLDKTDGWVWVVLVATWEDSYNAAVAYYTAHGKWPSSIDEDPEVKKLGTWAARQRAQGKKLAAGGESDMTRERYDRLEKTDGWVWGRQADAWENTYRDAVAYYSAHGKWPSSFNEDPEVKKLGTWVATQRTQGKKLAADGKSRLSRERYDRLEETDGWEWSKNHPEVPAWET